MAFCLDANIFIQGWHKMVPYDVMPGFWSALQDHARLGNVFSIDEVYREVTKGNDKLADWAKLRKKALFRPNSDDKTQAAFADDIQRAVTRRTPAYHSTAHAPFFSGADPWLLAHAHAHKHTIVTEERLERAATNKIRIPDVCRELDVHYVNTWDMMRELKIKLVAK